ncbi:DUF1036 domain-containing protein [Brevundimonas sp.]|uniref:DUF1036 domain-containing protein n=1 Tax=Brevundimonas sp. TaxID=1871086 RepID=UPI0035B33846
MKTLFVASLAVSVAAAPVAWAQAKPGPGTVVATGGNERPTVELRVCNNSGRNAKVAVSYVEVGASQFINRGWYDVADGACSNLVTTDNANFYFYADAMDGSGRRWQGNHSLCVEYPGPYAFHSDGSSECKSWQELRNFVPASATQPGVYTWTLDP